MCQQPVRPVLPESAVRGDEVKSPLVLSLHFSSLCSAQITITKPLMWMEIVKVVDETKQRNVNKLLESMGGEFMFLFQLHFDAVMTTELQKQHFHIQMLLLLVADRLGKWKVSIYLHFGADSICIRDLYAS